MKLMFWELEKKVKCNYC